MGKIKMCISHDLRREFQTLVGAEKRRGKEGNCGSLGCSFAVCLLSSSVCGPVLTNERAHQKGKHGWRPGFFLRLVAHKERVFLAPSLGAEKKAFK